MFFKKALAISALLLLSGAAAVHASTMQDVGKAADNTVQEIGSGLDALAQATSTVITDSAITTSIKAQYVKDADIDAFDVRVSTTDGVVTLSGHVPNSAQHQKAIALAKATSGVKSVQADQLKVMGNG